MATTYLYKDAPPIPSTSSSPSNSTWVTPASPSAELDKLREMSGSLVKEEWEITPVQAWFQLVDKIGMEKLRRGNDGYGFLVFDKMQVELVKLVQCFGFGAVINEVLFWDVVRTHLDV